MASVAEPRWPERCTITDAAAIALLVNIRAIRYLGPFLRRSHTLTSAAQSIHCSPSTMAYWLPRFVATGLVDHLRDQSRAGLRMPVYRAPARQLAVQYRDVPIDARVRLVDKGRMRVLNRFLDGLDESTATAGTAMLGFAAKDREGFSIDMIETEEDLSVRHFTDGWMAMRLTEEDARELSVALEALLQRYVDRIGPRRYIVHAGLAPDPRVRWRSAGDRWPF